MIFKDRLCHSNMYSAQDWEIVKFHKRTAEDIPKNTQLKPKAGKNTNQTQVISATKFENDEDMHIERVSTSLRQQIINGRVNAKLTQVELAKKVNELPKTIQEYENGKAIPNNAIIQKLSKALGVKLKK